MCRLVVAKEVTQRNQETHFVTPRTAVPLAGINRGAIGVYKVAGVLAVGVCNPIVPSFVGTTTQPSELRVAVLFKAFAVFIIADKRSPLLSDVHCKSNGRVDALGFITCLIAAGAYKRSRRRWRRLSRPQP